MAQVGFGLLVLSAIAAGVAAFLYNDGHDHKAAGLLGGGLSFLAMLVSSVAPKSENQEPTFNCRVYGEGCRDPTEGLKDWFGGILSGAALEMLLVFFCALVGLAVAKRTRHQPTDGRKSALLPPD